MEPTPDRHDWAALVRAHARETAVDLPPATIDELAAHLEDLYLAARAAGAIDADALDTVRQTLQTSGLDLLQSVRRPDSRAARARHADGLAAAARSRSSFAMVHGLRIALRQFRLQPLFAAIVVAVLGLGTGAAVTVYTIVDAVVLRRLPYRAPDRLVKLWDTNTEKGLARDPFSPVTFMEYRALPVFEDAAAWGRPDVNVKDPGLEPLRVKTI